MNTIIESLNASGARFTGFALPMLLQSAILIGLLFALDLALRKKVRSTIRYAVWMLALVKLALPPSMAFPTSAAYWLSSETAAISSAPTAGPIATLENSNPNSAYNTGSTIHVTAPLTTGWPELGWQAAFMVVWLTVALGMGIWVVWRSRMVAGLLRQSVEAPQDVRALQESCGRQLGIKRLIPVRCADIGSPAICGFLRPVVLIPPGLAENLGMSEMRSVLTHELAHFKRGDLWVNHAQILLQTLYWYNPLLWLANVSIRRAREQAVDEMVLVEMGMEAPEYPATLLKVAKLGLGRPCSVIGLMGILEPGRGLKQRILHIVNRPLPRTARIGARGLAAVMMLALIALPMASRTKAEQAAQPSADSASDWSGKQFMQPGIVGKTYTAGELAALEAKLIENPEDFSARRDLLLAYFMSNRPARAKHILWIIEHHPEFSASSGSGYLSLLPGLDGSAYGQGKELWLKHVRDNPRNATILGNAAAYLLISDRKTAEDLLKRAQVIEPQNPAWAEQLGQVYKLNAMGQPGTVSQAKALAEFEKEQQPGTAPAFDKLNDLAMTAYGAGNIEKARTLRHGIIDPGTNQKGRLGLRQCNSARKHRAGADRATRRKVGRSQKIPAGSGQNARLTAIGFLWPEHDAGKGLAGEGGNQHGAGILPGVREILAQVRRREQIENLGRVGEGRKDAGFWRQFGLLTDDYLGGAIPLLNRIGGAPLARPRCL